MFYAEYLDKRDTRFFRIFFFHFRVTKEDMTVTKRWFQIFAGYVHLILLFFSNDEIDMLTLLIIKLFCLRKIKWSTPTHSWMWRLASSTSKNLHKWYNLFTGGRNDFNDDAHPGRPIMLITDGNIEAMKNGESFNSLIRAISSGDLNMKRVATNRYMRVPQELVNEVNNDLNFLKMIITGNETGVWLWRQNQNLIIRIYRAKTEKVRQVLANVKVLVTVFLDYNGMINSKFLSEGRVVNTTKTPVFVTKQFKMHLFTRRCLFVIFSSNNNNTVILPQVLYSPDLDSCDFFVFLTLKRLIKSLRFARIKEIKTLK